MAFWNLGDVTPVRKYRFSFSLGGSNKEKEQTPWWWAKTVSKPSYEVNTSEYQLINHKFKYPGVLVWQDVNIVIVDVGGKAKSLMDEIKGFGYKKPTDKSKGIEKQKANCNIIQYDDQGASIEKWTLNNVFIKSINFGDLDYSSDEFVELQLTLMYDWAELESADSKDKKTTK
tara:strand:- start:4295 stop:4813 length:519 start_codon:yes stop_codon:yes gene_type:complete